MPDGFTDLPVSLVYSCAMDRILNMPARQAPSMSDQLTVTGRMISVWFDPISLPEQKGITAFLSRQDRIQRTKIACRSRLVDYIWLCQWLFFCYLIILSPVWPS